MNRSIVFRIILTLVLLAVVATLGVFAYNAGVAQGLAQNIQAAGGEGAKNLPAYPYYGMPYMHAYAFHQFGFLGCLAPLFLLFLFFGITRALFWHGHGWGHRGWYRHGMDRGDEEVPDRVQEWHRRMHEGPAEEKKA